MIEINNNLFINEKYIISVVKETTGWKLYMSEDIISSLSENEAKQLFQKLIEVNKTLAINPSMIISIQEERNEYVLYLKNNNIYPLENKQDAINLINTLYNK